MTDTNTSSDKKPHIHEMLRGTLIDIKERASDLDSSLAEERWLTIEEIDQYRSAIGQLSDKLDLYERLVNSGNKGLEGFKP